MTQIPLAYPKIPLRKDEDSWVDTARSFNGSNEDRLFLVTIPEFGDSVSTAAFALGVAEG